MRPFMVEFCGTPEAGKTTVIKKNSKILEEKDYNVNYVQESAETVPKEIPKGSWNANIYMNGITISSIIKSIYSSSDIVLIDRGYFDRQFWGLKFLTEGACSLNEFNSYLNSFGSTQMVPDLLIAFIAEPEEVIRRKGGEGRIVTKDYIEEFNKIFYIFYSSIPCIPKILLNTTTLSIDNVTELVCDAIKRYYVPKI